MTFNIRRIEEKDILEVYQIEKACFDDPWSENGIRGSLNQDHTVLLGAWIGGELAGYVIAYFSADDSEIARIAVKGTHRRRGVGRGLLEALRNVCIERGTGRILLDVRKGNEAAACLYKSFGFAEDGVRRNFYTQPAEDAVLMSFICNTAKLENNWQM